MYKSSSFARTVSTALLIGVLSALSAQARADDGVTSATAAPAAVSAHEGLFKGRIKSLGQKLAHKGGGFGHKTISRLKQIGARVADHLIANPEDIGDLDDVATAVAKQTPEMLAEEARQMKHEALSDAMRTAVDTVVTSTGTVTSAAP